MQRSQNGLRPAALSQWETIGQSLASIAPTATPAMGIPFILAISGNGSWLACLLAMLAIACVAHQINVFATRSSSSGSLSSFVEDSLGSTSSLFTAWALLIAYVGTGCAVTGGLAIYAYSLMSSHVVPSVLMTASITVVVVVLAGYLAFRDVHVSARLMLGIEAASILLILLLFLIPGTRSALHWDRNQWTLAGASIKQVRAGLVLAIFGFVGFESAASLGIEAVNPLKTIPRAITSTAWISGLFFVLAAYAETIGFGGHAGDLAQSGAPLQFLAHLRNMPFLAPLIAATTVCSFFACALACITAAARTLFTLSRDGHFHSACGSAHEKHQTPHIAILVISAVVLGVPLVMTFLHIIPFDVYGWSGTFATFGFITAYLMVNVGAAILIYRMRAFTPISIISLIVSFAVLLLAVLSAFEPSEGVYHWLPYLYLALLAGGTTITILRRRVGLTSTLAASIPNPIEVPTSRSSE